MIELLSQNTIDKIAAGEVIERPAAVVKELIENAIDSSANAITVEIKNGGKTLIRITDNGTGIAKKELSLAFTRHATSKIKNTEDLITVKSLGFRGEALSSISAVSMVECITKEKDQLQGCRYEIHAGKEMTLEDVGCPNGTTFIVRNLFYNTPARLKFLKSERTESGFINDLVERFSLSHPGIGFKFISDGKIKLQTSGNHQFKNNIYSIYGSDITKALLEVNCEDEGMKLTGYAAKPEVSRGNRAYLNYFVNGRYVKSQVISGAIEEAYKNHIMNHRYPFTVLFLTIDTKEVDVNVHPAKMEVRFQNQEKVYQFICDGIKEMLSDRNLIPKVSLDSSPAKQAEEKKGSRQTKKNPAADKKTVSQPVPFPEPFEDKRMEQIKKGEDKRTKQNKEVKDQQTEKTKNGEKPIVYPAELPIQEMLREDSLFHPEPDRKENTEKKDLPEKEYSGLHIIGQVFATYWLIEYKDELLIIDQHAAHEKVLYEKLLSSVKNQKLLSQSLTIPVIVTLSPSEEDALHKNKNSLEKLGFLTEHFGGKEYAVKGVPSDFLSLPVKELFLDFLGEMMKRPGGNGSPDMVLEKCASMACKAAVKGNQRLTSGEAEALIKQMLTLDHPYHCPHGRPTAISMTKTEFEKKFKRIV